MLLRRARAVGGVALAGTPVLVAAVAAIAVVHGLTGGGPVIGVTDGAGGRLTGEGRRSRAEDAGRNSGDGKAADGEVAHGVRLVSGSGVG